MARVPLLDYAFLAFETDASPKHVGGLQIFDLPRGAPRDYVGKLMAQAKLTYPKPPFDQRLHTSVVGRPDWQSDPVFDMENHMFHEQLPAPFSMEDLLERVSELHAQKLDRSIPLWEVYFFEHLKPDRFAIYFKVHHAYMDGIGLSQVAMASLSDVADPDNEVAFWNFDAEQYEQQRAGIMAALFGTAKRAGRAALSGLSLSRVGLLHGLRAMGLSGRELPIPFTAPRTAFNSRLTRRRSADVMSVSLQRMQSIAAHAGVTVNDVLLELCDSAMTRYLEDHHDAPDKPLVAQMPVSLRRDNAGQQNQITIALLELGQDDDDPVRRLQHIHQHTNDVKAEFRSMPAEAAEAYTVILQSAAQLGEITGLGGVLPPLGNVVISNVVGPATQMYLADAPLLAVYPISTIAPGLAINITSYTYNGELHIGVVTGAAAIPDLSDLMGYMRAALPQLEDKLGFATAASKPKKAPVRKKRAAKVGKTSPKRPAKKKKSTRKTSSQDTKPAKSSP